MRLWLRFSMFVVIAGLGWSQALTDAAGVIAGSSVGVGAGKQVGQGITAALDRANATTTKLAKTEKLAATEKPAVAKSTPRAGDGGAVLKTGPGGVVKDHSLVPPPPPAKKIAVVPPPPPLAPRTVAALTAPVLVLPPPPQVTPEELKTLANGTSKEEVLKLGVPASRITMMDDGHLVEIFRYQTRETTVGVVRLSDGSVSNVQIR